MQKKILFQTKINNAKEEDLPDILKIEEESSPNPWKRSFFEDELSNDSSTILIFRLDHGDEMAGFLVFRKIGDIVEVNNVGVKKDFRRKGVATSLLSNLLERSKREKVVSIFLEVRAKNKEAVRLYKKLGFGYLSIRKGYYSKPKDDALIYKLKLR